MSHPRPVCYDFTVILESRCAAMWTTRWVPRDARAMLE